MHLESRSFHDPNAAFYQKLGSESVSVLSGQALSVYFCHPNSKLDFVLTHDHGDVNHFLLAHIIFKPTSRAKKIVFWQSLFGNLDIILGHVIAKVGVAVKVEYIYTYIFSPNLDNMLSEKKVVENLFCFPTMS